MTCSVTYTCHWIAWFPIWNLRSLTNTLHCQKTNKMREKYSNGDYSGFKYLWTTSLWIIFQLIIIISFFRFQSHLTSCWLNSLWSRWPLKTRWQYKRWENVLTSQPSNCNVLCWLKQCFEDQKSSVDCIYR